MYRLRILCLLALLPACADDPRPVNDCADLGTAWKTLAPPPSAYTTSPTVDGASVLVRGAQSLDEGATWTDSPYWYYAVSGDVIYANAGGNGTGISHDHGATWEDHYAGLEVQAIDPDDHDVIYGTWEQLGQDGGTYYQPYRSEDGGATTVPMNIGASVSWFISAPSGHDRVYAYAVDGGGSDIYRRSDDRGATWKTISTGGWQLRFDPVVPDRVWRFQYEHVELSDDAGDTWQPYGSAPSAVTELMATADGPIAFTDQRSVFWGRSGDDWSHVGSTPIVVGQAFPGACSQSAVVKTSFEDGSPTMYLTHSFGG